jgi:D-threo-aldose 1-dehydrogenase
VLGLGAAPLGNFGIAIDTDTARSTVDAAWQSGVRYFDTAPHYGLGLSERRLGAALAAYPRDQFTISTKVGRLLVDNPAPSGSDLAAGGFDVPDDLARRVDYSRDGVLRSLEASLNRMGMDRIDVVYVHDPDDHLDTAITESLPTLVELREQGVIGAIGAGMNAVEPLRTIVARADVDAVMVAGRWTLLDRSAAQLLDDCTERGVSVVAAAPFNSGILASTYPPDGSFYDYGPAPEPVLRRARLLAEICTEAGVVLPHAAIQYPLLNTVVACVVAGARSPSQAIQNSGWMDQTLPSSLWSALGLAPNRS